MFEVAFDSSSWVPYLLALLVPVWFLGTLTGLMLPRPKWLTDRSILTSAILNLGFGQRLVLLLHGFMILRECWYRVFETGTFRLFLKSVWLWMCGKGWTFDFPHARDPSPMKDSVEMAEGDWYVDRSDLKYFKDSVQATGWQLMMEKNIPNLIAYKAWRRILPSGKTEYKSVSISPDATAEEFMDFYLDDDARPLWDAMISQHEVLEQGSFADRQMVVRWIRKFPFSFISDRVYTIARRLFRDSDGLFGVTKAVPHPLSKPSPKVVSMDTFHSMWKCRTVDCPWGSNRPACETVLLHLELFKIPENLARFAAKVGMWSFVHNMAQNVAPFVASRRQRCTPNSIDPLAYGSCHEDTAGVTAVRWAPVSGSDKVGMRSSRSLPSLNLLDSPGPRGASQSSFWGLSSMSAIEEDAPITRKGSSEVASEDGSSLERRPSKGIKGLATLAVAGSLAIILRRSGSATNLSPSEAASKKAARSRYPLNRYRKTPSELWTK